MHRRLGRFMGAQKIECAINCVFEAPACLVRGLDAFGHKLAHLKAVHPLRKCAMDLISVCYGARQERWNGRSRAGLSFLNSSLAQLYAGNR